MSEGIHSLYPSHPPFFDPTATPAYDRPHLLAKDAPVSERVRETSNVTAPAPRRLRFVAPFIIGGGIMAVSSASVLIRLASAPPLAVGSWRLGLAALLLTPLALPRLRREWPRLTGRDGLRIALAGLALAIHFASWITSLTYTTVASSVILVSTHPILVALAAPWLLGERVQRRTAWAIGIVLVGCVIVGYGDIDLSPRALLGDFLALIGALGAAVYVLFGREVRRKLSTWAYVWPCYGIAALILITFTLLMGQPLGGYPWRTVGIFALLAVGPQILGHSAFNWALGHLSAVFVTLTILGEPVGASLLALVILKEVPPPMVWLGGALILGGIVLASLSEMASSSAN